MPRTEIRVEAVDAFFQRGRKSARLADRGGAISASRVIAFDDVESLLRVLTEKRVLLLKQVREEPASISVLARRLKRDRSAVTKDVHLLERFGVVQVAERPLPGHGRQKLVFRVAGNIRLTAAL